MDAVLDESHRSTCSRLRLTCEQRGRLMSVDREKKRLDLYVLRRRGEASGSGWALERERSRGAELVDADGEIQACGVALDAKQGTKRIFLVSFRRAPLAVQSKAALYSIHTYSPSTGRVVPYGKRSVVNSGPSREALSQDVGCVRILDGPVVVWSEGHQLQTLYAIDHSHNTLQQQTYNVDNLISSGYRLVNVSAVWSFLWAEERDPYYSECSPVLIVFLKLSVAKDDGAMSDVDMVVREWVCLQVTLHQDGLSIKLLKEVEFVPRDYGCISTCVTLHKSYGVDFSSGDFIPEYQFLVGTEFHQVVLLCHGDVLRCIALEYVPVQIALLDSNLGQLTFACRGRNNEAAAYHVDDEDETKVCGSWQGVSEMVVGDFAHLGHDQLLLLFGNSTTDFIVTDLNKFSTASKESFNFVKQEDEEERASGGQCAESLVSVVNALHLRKHDGEAYLTSVETELQLKRELLKRSLSLLKSLEQHQPPERRDPEGEGGGGVEGEGRGGEESHSSTASLHSDPGLVCIIPGENGDPVGSIPTKTSSLSPAQPHSPSPLEVVKLWQRLKDGHWLIGTVLKNCSSCKLMDLRFSLSPPKSCHQKAATDCSSRVVWIESPPSVSSRVSPSPSDSSPPTKRRKFEEPLRDLLEELTEENKKGSDGLPTLDSGLKLCVVLSTAVPSLTGGSGRCCEESITIIATWKKAAKETLAFCGSPEEVSDVGVATLSHQQLCSGELNIHQSSLSLWNGKAMLSKEINLEQRGYQDLVCELGMSSFLQVEASSKHTNLLDMAAMLLSRLPLQSEAVITNNIPTDDKSGHSCSKFADGAIQSSPTSSCHSLEALEGVLLHITPRAASSARIAILFRSFNQLSLLLSLVKHCLPVDVSLNLLTSTSWSSPLTASLISILDESKGRCSHVEHRMRRRKDDCPKDDEKGEMSNELFRERTDLRMFNVVHDR